MSEFVRNQAYDVDDDDDDDAEKLAFLSTPKCHN